MITALLPLLLLFTGEKEIANHTEITQIPAMYKIPADSAEMMIHHFRSKKVDINDDKWMDGKDKKVVRARFDKSVLAMLLDNRVTSHEFFMAAFVADGRGRLKSTATMVLRIIKNTTSQQALSVEYYLPVEETLCPPPPDCNISPQIPE